MNNVITNKTFKDLKEFCINCEKDKNQNLILTPKDQYPIWLLSMKRPKKHVTLCIQEEWDNHRYPIIQFRWKSFKYGIDDEHVGLLLLYKEDNKIIPGIVSELNRSILDYKYIKYFGIYASTIQNLLIDLLN